MTTMTAFEKNFDEAQKVKVTLCNVLGRTSYVLTYNGYITSLRQATYPAMRRILKFKRDCDKQDLAYGI